MAGVAAMLATIARAAAAVRNLFFIMVAPQGLSRQRLG
jgi:hypothetical protein